MKTLSPTTDFTFDLVCRVLRELAQAELDTNLGKPGERIEVALCAVVEAMTSERPTTYREARARSERVLGHLKSAERSVGEIAAELAQTPLVQRIRAGVATLTAVFEGRTIAIAGGVLPRTQGFVC